jgi:hypothetical protein
VTLLLGSKGTVCQVFVCLGGCGRPIDTPFFLAAAAAAFLAAAFSSPQPISSTRKCVETSNETVKHCSGDQVELVTYRYDLVGYFFEIVIFCTRIKRT